MSATIQLSEMESKSQVHKTEVKLGTKVGGQNVDRGNQEYQVLRKIIETYESHARVCERE